MRGSRETFRRKPSCTGVLTTHRSKGKWRMARSRPPQLVGSALRPPSEGTLSCLPSCSSPASERDVARAKFARVKPRVKRILQGDRSREPEAYTTCDDSQFVNPTAYWRPSGRHNARRAGSIRWKI